MVMQCLVGFWLCNHGAGDGHRQTGTSKTRFYVSESQNSSV
uniref:Uncharacterized protein n=1 Tax=Anguilla anguilla TaxID=7936 RepID=A0A0E9XD31_ANGAN